MCGEQAGGAKVLFLLSSGSCLLLPWILLHYASW